LAVQSAFQTLRQDLRSDSRAGSSPRMLRSASSRTIWGRSAKKH
jgi:hypothetical protein